MPQAKYSLITMVLLGLLHLFHAAQVTVSNSTPVQPAWTNACPAECICSMELVLPDESKPQRAVKCALTPAASELFLPTLHDLPRDLEALTLRECSLPTIADLCCIKQLRFLDLSFNRIDSLLSYESFDSLEFMDLSHNRLQLLRREEFIAFPKIVTLNLENNQIASVHSDAFRLLNLKRLLLGSNKIKLLNERTFRFLASLETLGLSNNQLTLIYNRNFYYLKRLKHLDLSRNGILSLPADAFEPLRTLESLDLSYNNLTEVPLLALMRQRRLRQLKLSGNNIRRLSPDSFYNLSVDELHLSESSTLELIPANAFNRLPSLKKIYLTKNARLTYLSKDAFAQQSSLREIHLDSSGIEAVPAEILQLRSLEKISLTDAKLDCNCFRREIVRSRVNIARVQSLVSPTLQCIKYDGTHEQVFSESFNFIFSQTASLGRYIDFVMPKSCNPRIHPPYDEAVEAFLGEPMVIYCAVTPILAYGVVWILPENETVLESNGTFSSGPEIRPSNYTSLTVSAKLPAAISLQAGAESLRIGLVTETAGGTYVCRVSMKSNVDGVAFFKNMSGGFVQRSVKVTVLSPASVLSAGAIGANFVTLQWSHSKQFPDQTMDNYKIHIRQADQTQTQEVARFSHTRRGQTIFGLIPDTNYTFCLVYVKQNVTLYRTCLELRTKDASFLNAGISLNYGLIGVISVLVSFISGIFIIRCVYHRVYVWQKAKAQSRLQGSLSGQGLFRSLDSLRSDAEKSSSSAHQQAMTYENKATIMLEENGSLLTVSSNGIEMPIQRRIDCFKEPITALESGHVTLSSSKSERRFSPKDPKTSCYLQGTPRNGFHSQPSTSRASDELFSQSTMEMHARGSGSRIYPQAGLHGDSSNPGCSSDVFGPYQEASVSNSSMLQDVAV